MDSLVFIEIRASHVAIDSNSVASLVSGLNHVESVCYHIGMVDTPTQRLDLLNRNKTSQVMDLCLGVQTVLLLA